MGLISRVSSRTYRKTWPFILTEYYQTLTSESERPGPNLPKPGSTNQPKKSPDEPPEPSKPNKSLPDQLPVLSDPSFKPNPSDTTLNNESVEVSPPPNSKLLVCQSTKPNKLVSALTSDESTNLPKTCSETSND